MLKIRFGEFVIEPETRRLRHGEVEVRLGPKAFGLLELLVDRRPRVLSKAQIRDRLWPRTVVSESCLATLVGELRAALGDDARRPRFIRTAYGFGYSFYAPASESQDSDVGEERGPRLVWQEREFPLVEGENLIGRSKEADARVAARTVSRRHATITMAGGVATLQDLGSKNGTFVEGERLRSHKALTDGDEIRMGRIRLTFRASSETSSTAAEDSR